jgi:hypothetical protein
MFMPKAAEIPRARVLLIDGEGQVWSHGGGRGIVFNDTIEGLMTPAKAALLSKETYYRGKRDLP